MVVSKSTRQEYHFDNNMENVVKDYWLSEDDWYASEVQEDLRELISLVEQLHGDVISLETKVRTIKKHTFPEQRERILYDTVNTLILNTRDTIKDLFRVAEDVISGPYDYLITWDNKTGEATRYDAKQYQPSERKAHIQKSLAYIRSLLIDGYINPLTNEEMFSFHDKRVASRTNYFGTIDEFISNLNDLLNYFSGCFDRILGIEKVNGRTSNEIQDVIHQILEENMKHEKTPLTFELINTKLAEHGESRLPDSEIYNRLKEIHDNDIWGNEKIICWNKIDASATAPTYTISEHEQANNTIDELIDMHIELAFQLDWERTEIPNRVNTLPWIGWNSLDELYDYILRDYGVDT